MRTVLLPLLTESEVQLLEAGEEEDKAVDQSDGETGGSYPTAEITGHNTSEDPVESGAEKHPGEEGGKKEVGGGGGVMPTVLDHRPKIESVWGIHFLEIPKRELFPNPMTIIGHKAVLHKSNPAPSVIKLKRKKKEPEKKPAEDCGEHPRVADAETTKRMLARVLENRRLRRMGSKIALVKSESFKRMFCEDDPGYHPLKPAEKMENIEPISLPRGEEPQVPGCTGRVCRASAPAKKKERPPSGAVRPASSFESVTSLKDQSSEPGEEPEEEPPEEERSQVEQSNSNVFNRLYRLAMGPQQMEKRARLRMRKELALTMKTSKTGRNPFKSGSDTPGPAISTQSKKALPKISIKTSVQRFKTRIGPRMRGKKASLQEAKNESLYPETIQPFSNPKEAITRVILQLENPEWEVVMQGLQGLVRLGRHHTKLLQPSLHSIVLLLGRHIKNLRSQVARAATQAAMHLFVSLGRLLDSGVDDLTNCLLSRMADTNKFLRGDSSAALSAMVDNVSPHKSVSALVNKGAKHQNAVMRCATGRLLVQLCTRLGPERVMQLPKETRDAILITGAKLLTEGSLETRRHAKELFTVLSADPRLMSIMNEVVPANNMRSIGKILIRICSKQ